MTPARKLRKRIERGTIERLLALVSSEDKTSILRAARLAEKLAPAHLRHHARWVVDQLQDETPILQLARRIAHDLSPACRQRLIGDLIGNGFLDSREQRAAFVASSGAPVPIVLLISPTMRCNLACQGCYAGAYAAQPGLSPAQLQSIVDQANAIGIYLFTILGGEPFLYPGLLDFAAANPESYFQVFTNGTLLDGQTIARLAQIGNVAPMLSLEGDREATDARRGRGIYDRVLAAMDKLQAAGVGYGVSATVTRRNYRYLISDAYVDLLLSKGAIIAWHFLYMPLGRDPDMNLMLTPAERNELRLGILEIRRTRPLLALDFWGDAPLVGGCIAARYYLHINSEGWVEPCIFTHFATHNIKDCTLAQAISSPYFAEIRRRQPFNENLLLPCMWIDNPQQSREIMAATGARPTHEGADVMLTELRGQIDDYAAAVQRVYAPLWSCRGGYARRAQRDDGGQRGDMDEAPPQMKRSAQAGAAR
jgi:MoaA/NifB/PqqE/SkfB family radical SAM enzyme